MFNIFKRKPKPLPIVERIEGSTFRVIVDGRSYVGSGTVWRDEITGKRQGTMKEAFLGNLRWMFEQNERMARIEARRSVRSDV